jgi:peptide/nickel transport system substrate-binding protein
MKSRAVGAVLLAFALLTLMSCSSSVPSSPNKSGQKDSQFDRDATLRIAFSLVDTSMDPTTTSNAYDYVYLFFVYDRLTYVNKDDVPEPMLATSWDILDGGKALELHLRKGLKFSDGTPFNAHAVVANIKRETTLPTSSVKTDLAAVTKATAVNEYTVQIDLSDTSAGALPAILGGLPGAMVSPAAFKDTKKLTEFGDGIGPYRVTQNLGADGMTMVRTSGYWDPAAQKVAKFEFQGIDDDATRLTAVETGAVDGALIRAPEVVQAKAAGLDIVSGLSAAPTILAINQSHGDLANVDVRRAIWQAIDAKQISSAVFNGTCQVDQQLFSPDSWAYDPNSVSPLATNLAAAKKSVAESGITDPSFGESGPPSQTYSDIAQILQAQLAKAGITLNLTTVNSEEIFQQFYVAKTLDSSITAAPYLMDPSQFVTDYLLPGGFDNVGGYKNSQLDALALKAESLASDSQRAQIYHQIQKIIWDEALNPVVLCYQHNYFAFSPKVTGMQIDSTGVWDFRFIQTTK